MAEEKHSDLNSALELFVGVTPKPKELPARHVRTNPQKQPEKLPAKARESAKKNGTNTFQDTKPADGGVQHTNTEQKDEENAPKEKAVTIRMGRPTGVRPGKGRPKGKTSLALDLELMNRYREQTWGRNVSLVN